MNIYLLRHAIAAPVTVRRGTTDSQRRLTREGRTKMKRVAKGMKSIGLDFDLILTSPYQRALETAEIVAQVFKTLPGTETSRNLTPAGRREDLVREILEHDPLPNDVLLVGHEPNLSNLISFLVGGRDGFCVTMKKSGLCKLSVAELKPGRCASLEWLLTPRQLALLA